MRLIIDGDNAAHRCRHVYGSMRLPDGTGVGPAYGLLQHVVDMAEEFSGVSKVVVAWDGAGATEARRRVVPEYKSGRARRRAELAEEDREELRRFYAKQMPLCRYLLARVGIPQVVMPGAEADDVISVIGTTDEDTDGPGETIISSTDSDLIQLVRHPVRVYNPVSRRVYYCAPGEQVIRVSGEPSEREVVSPGWQVYLARRALAGDKSDSIPGVPGVGPTIAREIIPDGYQHVLSMEMPEPDGDEEEWYSALLGKWVGVWQRRGTKRARRLAPVAMSFADDEGFVRNLSVMALGHAPGTPLRGLVKAFGVWDEKRSSQCWKLYHLAVNRTEPVRASLRARRMDKHHLLHPCYFAVRQVLGEFTPRGDNLGRLGETLNQLADAWAERGATRV